MTPRVPLDVVLKPPPEFRDAGLVVGYSGGLDSTVLLHALAHQGFPRLQVVHVHHGMQTLADDWVRHAEQFCASLDLPLSIEHVAVRSAGQGIEAAAREARYAAFARHMQAGDLLALAHHQDDQAETVLLNLLRGSGPAGLAAMRPISAIAAGHLWRPLLDVPRAEVLEYAQAHQLSWIEDPHNHDPSFARSALRAQVMPLLRARWSAASRLIARAAALQAESSELQQELALSDLAQVDARDQSLSIPALLALSPSRRRNLLRAWVGMCGLDMPYLDTLVRVDTEVLRARVDAEPLLCWPGGEFRRYRDRLFVMARLAPVATGFCAALTVPGQMILPPACGRLVATGAWTQSESLSLRLVREGDRFRPPGSPQARSLKTLFQSRSIPPWVRPRTPVLEGSQGLIWIGGIGWSADRPETLAALELDWANPPAATVRVADGADPRLV